MVLGIYLASDDGFLAYSLGLVLGWDHVCPAFFLPNAAASLVGNWRGGRFPGMHMVLSIAS